MKKTIFAILFVLTFIPNSSFASEIYGWWVPEKEYVQKHELLLITEKIFFGGSYKTLENSNNIIKISLMNSDDPTIIQINSDDKITITSVNKEKFLYRKISNNINMSRNDAMKLFKKAKMDQTAK